MTIRQIATLFLVAAASCASPARPAEVGPHTVSERPKASAAEPGLRDAAWDVVGSRRLRLSIALPERARWRIDDESEPWFVLTHAATDSELRLRIWRAPRRVSSQECEAQARLWRPDLPRIADETTLAERRLEVPQGYHTRLVGGVRASGDELEGYALAFGASVGKCFAAVFTTRAGGPFAQDVIAKRLALIIDESLARVSERGIDDRVPRSR